MKRRLVFTSISLVFVGTALVFTVPALAHPVRIGRYAAIPYGIDPAHPYPTAGGGPRRSGRTLGVAPTTEPTLLWSRTLRQRRPRGPAVAADGSLYLGTVDGLTALEPDGTERWTLPLGPVRAMPSLAPGGDIVVVNQGGVVALVTREGLVRHTVTLPAPARNAPLVLDDGSMLVSTIDGRLHRLDANLRRVTSGATLGETTSASLAGSSWVPGLAVDADTTVALAAPNRFVVPSGRTVALLDPAGRVRQRIPIGGRATMGALVGDDGTIWVPLVDGALVAIDSGGRVRARAELGSRLYGGFGAAIGRDGAVRVPTLTEGLVCVGPSGALRWTLPNAAGYNAPVTLDEEDTALVVDRGGRMHAVAADGALRWQVSIGTYSLQAPVIGPDGVLYIATEQGELQAWGSRRAL